MSVIETRLNLTSETSLKNEAHMRGLVAELEAKSEKLHLGGGEKYMEKHIARGKLPVRERINALIDAGSPFLEVNALAADDMYGDNIASAGIVAGIGRIEGIECMIVANDATVKGGTYFPMTVHGFLLLQRKI